MSEIFNFDLYFGLHVPRISKHVFHDLALQSVKI